jgi:hypothetical protein
MNCSARVHEEKVGGKRPTSGTDTESELTMLKKLWNLVNRRKPKRAVDVSCKESLADDYRIAAMRLRIVQAALTNFLQRGRSAAHKDMKEVSPGCWIHKDFKDFAAAMEWLKSILPESSANAEVRHGAPDDSK